MISSSRLHPAILYTANTGLHSVLLLLMLLDASLYSMSGFQDPPCPSGLHFTMVKYASYCPITIAVKAGTAYCKPITSNA